MIAVWLMSALLSTITTLGLYTITPGPTPRQPRHRKGH